jgi:Ribbon-helix-helix domain
MTTKRLKILQSLYLESDRTHLLDELAADVRLPKAILLREAVDDLLVKYRMLKPNKRLALLKAVR